MGGTGVDLLAGSNLNIRYDGSIGRVLSHVSHFDTVVGSTIGFDLQFGAGNDFDIAVILGGPIEDDTSVTGLVNLGSGGKGSVQLDWSRPTGFRPQLRWYVQYFDGYGESLIDYNHHQTTVGLGVLLTD